MAKSKQGKKYYKIIAAAAAVLGLVAFFMMFAPAAVFTAPLSKETVSYTGAQAAFGYSQTTTVVGSDITVQYLAFSFMNFLPYLCIVAAIVLSVLGILGKLGKIADFAAALLYVLAGVFFFCTVAFLNLGEGYEDIAEYIMEYFTLGAGAVVAGVLSLIAGIACAANAVLFKK